ncbi:MAG: alpha/beta hydrolase [Thermoplasmata archaeon]|nr:alpha/beta hydrolase [Thermoplasmata archaeon]
MSAPAPLPVELFARVEGSGPPILLLHGLGGDHTVFRGVIPALARRFLVIAPDLRGHGRSPTPPALTFTSAEMEADLRALLARHDVSSAHVVGLSAGGFLALQWAIDTPEWLRSLTLIGASTHCDNHTRAVAQNWAETYRTQGYDAFMLRLLKDLFYPDWIEAHMEVADALREKLRDRDLRGAFAWGEAVRTFDLRGRFGKIKLPTLIIQGVDDAVVDGSHGRLLRQAIQGAQLKLFAQSGHLVPVEHPEETAAAIESFVERLESAGRASASAAG